MTVTTAGNPGACITADGNNIGLCTSVTACATGTQMFITGACATSTTVTNALYYTATGAAAAC